MGAETCRRVLVPWLHSQCAEPFSRRGDAITYGGTRNDVSLFDGTELVERPNS